MNRRAAWSPLLSIVAALLYGASPIDLIPDVIPLIGWLDDGLVIALLLGLAAIQFRRHRRAPRAIGR